MKTLLLAAFALFASTAAFAFEHPTPDYGVYYKVLSCDNGAAILDNMHGYGRGGDGLGAQVVIHDANVVEYFRQSGAGGTIVDSQWIYSSFFEAGQSAPFTSFSSNGNYVTFDANSDTLQVVSGRANWTFRDCVKFF